MAAFRRDVLMFSGVNRFTFIVFYKDLYAA